MAKELHSVFTVEELKNIRTAFAKADVNNDNHISFQEFQTLVSQTLGGADNTKDLFSLFDKNADGKITFEELVGALAVLIKGSAQEKSEFLFDFYDKDHDGVLTTEEIRTLLHHLKEDLSFLLGQGKEHQAQLEAEAIVKKLDVNGDGKITRAEWVEVSKTDDSLLTIFGLGD